MSEPVKKPAGPVVSAAPGVPGMSVGSPPAAKVPATDPLAAAAGLAAGKPAAEKKPFGGNAGRKPRADGLKPGSPEAIAADKAADAERKRREREARRLAEPPPPLPAGAPMAVEPAAADVPAAGLVAGDAVDPVVCWTVEDFRQCAPELVELAEAWRIDSHTKAAAAGKLPAPVVNEIAKSAAFPPGSKKSLSTASPVTLAKMFNALKVPVAFKGIISAAPALAYIIVRDLQTSARIEKLVAEHKEHREKAEGGKAESGKYEN